MADDRGPRPPRRSLLWQLFSTNAAVLVAAFLLLGLTPLRISLPVSVGAGIGLLAGLFGMLYVNLLLMRRALGPLGRLREAMVSVDPLHPGQRIALAARSVEVADLAHAFNDMLDRLEQERRDSARRAQAAQEAERRWLSLELHDEIGQAMTALLLQLDVVSRTATTPQEPVLGAAVETTRECLERVRTIVRRLRPEGLDDLGLTSALFHLCERMTASSGLEISRAVDRDLPPLSPDAQLVVFRVAQESLTNVVRHARADHAEVRLARRDGGVRLEVRDDGLGVGAKTAASGGSGIRGMRERALMIGSRLSIAPLGERGTVVALDVPPTEVQAS
jgi:two-component system, NarL family, sensor histidine kinase UhpB